MSKTFRVVMRYQQTPREGGAEIITTRVVTAADRWEALRQAVSRAQWDAGGGKVQVIGVSRVEDPKE